MSDNPSLTSKFRSQIEEFGIKPSVVHRNLPVTSLIETAVQKK